MSQTHLLVWGNNNQNILSSNPTQCLTKPEQIIFNFNIIKISATQKHISFITNKGQVYSYGSNSDGRLGIGQKDNLKYSYKNPVKVNLNNLKAKDIKCGFSHVCVQTQNNQIYSWGLGQYGALGIGEFKTRSTPTKVLIPPNIKKISCGAMHTSFLDTNGNLYMCGSNEYGQLGVKNHEKIGTPILLPTFSETVKQVACGVFYTLILTQKGQVYGMGNNKYAQLGLGHKINQSIPKLIKQLTNISAIQAGYHSGALNQYNQLYLWGSGSFGEFLRPRKFVLSTGIRSLQIRGFFGLAANQVQNKYYIWGNNTHGQLGNGGYISYKKPTEMTQFQNKKIKNIFCGVNFAIAILQQRQHIKKHDYSYSPINNFSSRKHHKQHSLQSSPHKQLKYQYPKQSYNQSHQVYNLSTKRQTGDLLVRSRSGQQQKKIEAQILNRQSARLKDRQNARLIDRQSARLRDRQSARVIDRQNAQIAAYTVHKIYQKDYQKLFYNLSKDYQLLANRFNQLQFGIQQRQIKRSKDQQFMQFSQQKQQNLLLIQNNHKKQQIYFLQKQLITTKQQLTISLDRIANLQDQLKLINMKFNSYKMQSPVRKNKINQNQLLLEQKDKIINGLQSRLKSSQLKVGQLNLQNEQKCHRLKILQESLSQQQIFRKQIKQKYKKILQDNQQNKLQNITLKQMLIKSQDKLLLYQNDLKNIINEKQCQILTNQSIQYKKKLIQLQQKYYTTEKLLQNQKVITNALQQQRKKLYQTLQAVKYDQKQYKQIKQKKLDQQKQKINLLQDKIKIKQTQINHDKQFMIKLQQKSKQVDRLREQTCKQLQKMSLNYQKQRKKKKQLQRQTQRFKSTENQLKILKQQLQKQRQLNQTYKDKVQKQYKKKDYLIKQMQQQLKNKQNQFEQMLSSKSSQIQQLNQQIQTLKQRLQSEKINNKTLNKQLSIKIDDIQNLQTQITKYQRKFKHSKQQMQKELQQKQQIIEQLGIIRKQKTRTQIQKQQLHKKAYQLQRKNTQLQHNIKRQQQKYKQYQKQFQQQNNKLTSLKQQNNYIRSQLSISNSAVQQANKISEQLSKANKQFSQNQQQLNRKVQQLQAKIYELQDQNKSYTPRYDALIQKNRELQQRNRQLSQMINKAIQIQAQRFKNNILKQVEINSNQIIQEVQDQKKYKQRYNRKLMQEQKQSQYHQNDQTQFIRTNQPIQKAKQQPYTKYMNQKIQSHKQRVSESAQKLAGILDLDNGIGSAFTKRNTNTITKRNNDQHYEKINHHMDSLNNQKEAFMQKINSFASKMKLL